MRLAIATLAVLCLVLAACGGGAPKQKEPSAPTSPEHAMTTVSPPGFAVTSPAFADNTQIPVEYSCKGRDVPPPLRFQRVPTGTESLALVVDDPDAPGGRYIHWIVTGIPPSTTEITHGALPEGARVGHNSGGEATYLGPCPPAGSGVHHYRFQLYALSKPLTLAPTTPAREAANTIAGTATAVVRTVGLFGR